jgi:hypothetical protein
MAGASASIDMHAIRVYVHCKTGRLTTAQLNVTWATSRPCDVKEHVYVFFPGENYCLGGER